MKKIIDIKEIENYPKLLEIINHNCYCLNNESELYLKGQTIYKVLDIWLRSKREEIVIKSSKHRWKYLVPIFDILYDNNGFYGYSMPFLKGSLVNQRLGKMPFIAKLELLNHLDQAFLELYERGFIYVDWHTSNIIVNQNFHPTLLDRDGIQLEKDLLSGSEYWVMAFFWAVLTSILYDTDFSLNDLTLDIVKLMGLKDFRYDLSFFEAGYFQKLLAYFEEQGESFFKEQKEDAIALVLK